MILINVVLVEQCRVLNVVAIFIRRWLVAHKTVIVDYDVSFLIIFVSILLKSVR